MISICKQFPANIGREVLRTAIYCKTRKYWCQVIFIVYPCHQLNVFISYKCVYLTLLNLQLNRVISVRKVLVQDIFKLLLTLQIYQKFPVHETLLCCSISIRPHDVHFILAGHSNGDMRLCRINQLKVEILCRHNSR